jgi:hypothetical protein
MANFTNIPTGLKIPAQIPLDTKTYCFEESILADLGIDNNFAYTYYNNLNVYCFKEKTNYVWREVASGEENTGLVPTDFIYPDNIIVFGVDYSLKRYNFFQVTQITTDNLADEIGTLPPGPAGENGATWRNGAGAPSNGLGVDNDYYLNNTNGDVYKKLSGSYIVQTNIKGPQGNPGTDLESLQYDTKEIVIDNTYLAANFVTTGPTTGLGKNLRLGWAIMNGNNGTPNDTGLAVIAYGDSFPTIGAVVGVENITLAAANIPKLNLTVPVSQAGGGTPTPTYVVAGDSSPNGNATFANSIGNSSPTAINNMQPSVVRVRIMKL